MKKLILYLAVITFLATTVFTQSAKKVAGTYQNCLSHCETYNIKADLTFDYLLDGDLFNNERTSGTWEFVGPNKIHLKSPKTNLIRKVDERSGESSDSIKITVHDPEGDLFPSTIYILLPNETEAKFRTENGECVIPQTSEFTIHSERSSEQYKIVNPDTTEIDIEIEAWLPPVINDDFVIEKGKICIVTEDGQRGYCLRKISSKRAKELFPEK